MTWAPSWAALVEHDVVAGDLKDHGPRARDPGPPRLEEAEGRGVGVAPRLDRELEVVARVVRWRVHREGPSRPVLEPLIHRQDHEAPGARERAVGQKAREVRQRPGVVAAVPAQDLAYPLRRHCRPPMKSSAIATSSGLPMTSGTRACGVAGSIVMIRSCPVLARPPACSARKAMGAASYWRRSFPEARLAPGGER